MREQQSIYAYNAKSFRTFKENYLEWRGPKWISNLLFKFGWLQEKQSFEEIIRYNDVNHPDLSKAIVSHINDLIKVGVVSYDTERLDFIIGQEDWEKLIHQSSNKKYLEIPLSYMLDSDVRGTYRILGIKVTVVPWMKGWVLLPRNK